jgi:hypothetical protein
MILYEKKEMITYRWKRKERKAVENIAGNIV